MKARRWKIGRDSVLFVTGLVFAAHEVFLGDLDRPSILALAALLMGLPAYMRFDEKRRNGNEEKP